MIRSTDTDSCATDQLPFGNTYLYVGANPVNRVDPTGADYGRACAAGIVVSSVVTLASVGATVATGGVAAPTLGAAAATAGKAVAGGCAGGLASQFVSDLSQA